MLFSFNSLALPPALLGLITFLPAAILAQNIPVKNFSFESPAVPANPGYTPNKITDWNGGGGNGNPFGDFGTQSLAVTLPNYPGGIPDGAQFAYVNAGFIFQGTGTLLESGDTYTLTAYLGRRADDPGAAGSLSLENFINGLPSVTLTTSLWGRVCLAAPAAPRGGAQSGRTFFVAPNGDDAGPGTATRPWRTVQKAADTLAPGDTAVLRTGTYRERVVAHHSGTPGRPLYFAAAPKAMPVLDGEGLPGDAVFDTAGQSDLQLSGLTLRGALPAGIGVQVHGSDRVTVVGCRIADCAASGVMIEFSSHVRLVRDEVTRACRSGGEETISLARHSQWCEITGCHIHHTSHEGIDIKQGAAHVRVHDCDLHDVERQGLYAEAWDQPTTDIVFSGNRVHSCGFGAAAGSEEGGLLSDVWFVNNVIYANRGPGLVAADWGNHDKHHPVSGLHWINNTICDNAMPGGWGGGAFFENADVQGVVVRNNILSGNGLGQVVVIDGKRPKNWTVDHNLLDGAGNDPGTDDLHTAPRFVNAAAGDFHLRPDSPAVGRGSSDGAPSTDADGRRRPTARLDLGAYAGPHQP